jgi:hypothetical protein
MKPTLKKKMQKLKTFYANIAGNPREPLQLKSTTRGLFRWKQFGRAKGDFRYCKESSPEECALRRVPNCRKIKRSARP